MSCFGIVIADEKILNPFDRDIIQINAAFTYKALGLSLVFFSTLCNIILDIKINYAFIMNNNFVCPINLTLMVNKCNNTT